MLLPLVYKVVCVCVCVCLCMCVWVCECCTVDDWTEPSMGKYVSFLNVSTFC